MFVTNSFLDSLISGTTSLWWSVCFPLSSSLEQCFVTAVTGGFVVQVVMQFIGAPLPLPLVLPHRNLCSLHPATLSSVKSVSEHLNLTAV